MRCGNCWRSCDAVITSGGVSVGQKDYLPACAGTAECGHALCRAWPRSPEAPCWPAELGGKLVFCLSGNPFAAAATLEQYAVPALLRAAGRREESCLLPRTTRTLTTGFSKPSKGNRYLRAKAMRRQRDHPRRGQRRSPLVRQRFPP